jgi:hypothetical protein
MTMRGFRLKPKAGTTAVDNSAVIVHIHGGLPVDHPDYAAAQAQVLKSIFNGRKVVTRGGLPDDMPNPEPEVPVTDEHRALVELMNYAVAAPESAEGS